MISKIVGFISVLTTFELATAVPSFDEPELPQLDPEEIIEIPPPIIEKGVEPLLRLKQKQRGLPCTLGWWWGTERIIVPLKGVSVKARVETGLTKTSVDLTYNNQLSEEPIEVTFSYPLVKDQVVQAFTAVIGNKTVIAKIKNKEVAKKEYEEAKNAGKGTIFAERTTKNRNEFLNLKLGNLQPGQDAVITIKLIESANELVGGAYSYKVPNKYFPRYKIKGDKRRLPYPDYDPNAYNFDYKVELAAPKGKKINYVSTPSFADYIEKEGRGLVTVEEPTTNMPPRKDIRIFYKTTDMMLTPNLFIERDPIYPDKVAVGATFAPSFDNSRSTSFVDYTTDEEPQKLPVNGTDFHFVFILDRSGSMQGDNIVVARKALQLFVQSLPKGSKFSIISFGDRWELHKNFGGEINSDSGTFNYTDQTLSEAVKAIGNFQADFGGTQLDEPIKAARELLDNATYAKNARIFVLTDGQVWDSANVYKQVEDLPSHLRISTFGIGMSFDEQLVTRVAEKGRGSVSRIYDLDQGSLSSAAVLALNRAMYPSLPGCNITWSGEQTEKLNEVFYNQLVSSFRIFNMSQFENDEVDFTFTCKNNPQTGEPIQQTFSSSAFRDVPAKSGFFKMAARSLVKKTQNKEDREEIALKYQILSPETAFIGVIEEDGQVTDKVIKIEIKNDLLIDRPVEVEGLSPPMPMSYSQPKFYSTMARSMPAPMAMITPTSMPMPQIAYSSNSMAGSMTVSTSMPMPEMFEDANAAWGGDDESVEYSKPSPPSPEQIKRMKDKMEAIKKAKEAAEKAAKEAEKQKEIEMWAAKTGRPDLDELINVYYVSADGIWKEISEQMLVRFFEDKNLPANPDTEKISKSSWMTLLALYILEDNFSTRSSEWTLIAQKGKESLTDNKVVVEEWLTEIEYMDLEIIDADN